MIVDDVEVPAAPPDLFDLRHRVGERITRIREPQSARATGHQLRRGPRVPACEQHHLVSAPHKLFGEPADNALRPAVVDGRHRFGEGCELGDPHGQSPRVRGSAPHAHSRLGPPHRRTD